MNDWMHALEPRRLMDAGDLDVSFGSGGEVVLAALDGVEIAASEVDVTESSQIVVTGITPGDVAEGGDAVLYLWRLHPGGARDLHFGAGGDGPVTLPIPRQVMRQFEDRFFAPPTNTVATLGTGVLVQMGNLIYKLR